MKWYLRAVALVFLLALVALRIADPWPVRMMRDTYFDYLQRLQPRAYTPLPVRIVTIDDAALKALGQWPWPRDRMAELNGRLATLGAAVVVWDFLFSEPDRLSPVTLLRNRDIREALGAGARLDRLAQFDNDATFAQSMAQVPTVLATADAGEGGPAPPSPKAGFAAVGADPLGALFPLRSGSPVLPRLAEAAAGIGVVTVDPGGSSNVIRSVPLVWQAGGAALPGLSLEALRVALGQRSFVLRGPNGGPPQIDEVRLGQFRIPTTENGFVLLHYRPSRPEDFVSALEVLQGGNDLALGQTLAGSIVLVGASAAGLSDIRTTVLGEQVPGVAIHAQMIEQMLTDGFLRRGTAVQVGEILALAAVSTLLLIAMSSAGPQLAFITGGISAAITLALSWYAFVRLNVLADASYPLVGGFVVFSGLAMFRFAVTDRERRAIRQSFLRYVSPDVLADIERSGHKLALGGEIRAITVMFSDVRNFTPLSETMAPQDLVAMLNAMFTEISQEILRGRGTIDKYIGDEVMAFWNAPLELPQHELQACRAALGMRGALQRFNQKRAAEGKRTIEMGIGLDSGEACVGNIGSNDRFNYTAIGETVNVAARTQAACKRVGYDIVVTEPVATAAEGLAFLPAGRLVLKGVSDTIPVCVLLGDETLRATPAFTALAEAHAALLERMARGSVSAMDVETIERLAWPVDKRLSAFYAALPGRLEDFTAPVGELVGQAMMVSRTPVAT